MTGREGGTATFIGLRTIFRRLRPSCRFGFEEGMKCPKCRRRRRIRQLHDNDGGGTGSKDVAASVRVDDAKGRLFARKMVPELLARFAGLACCKAETA